MLGWNEFVKKPPLRRPHAGLILPTVTSAMTPSTLQPMYSFDVLVIDARDALHNSRHARRELCRASLPRPAVIKCPISLAIPFPNIATGGKHLELVSYHLRLLAQYIFINTMQDSQKPNVPSTTDLEREVAQLMIECLNLEVTIDQITADAPLYGDGLGLDSIDVLEVALVVSKRYGLQLRSDSEDNQHIFSSLRSLCDYIAAKRTL